MRRLAVIVTKTRSAMGVLMRPFVALALTVSSPMFVAVLLLLIGAVCGVAGAYVLAGVGWAYVVASALALVSGLALLVGVTRA